MPELDYDEIVASFDESYEPEETETPEESLENEDGQEPIEGEDQPESTEDETEVDDESEPEQQQQAPEFKSDKQNQAFAELRRKAQENEQYAALVQKMADQAGVKPEEIIQRFEERTIEQEAQSNGMSVDAWKRLKSLEQESEAERSARIAERMDRQINDVITKYGATDEDIRSTFEEMIGAGVDPRTNPNADFEKFYRAANFEKIMEYKVNEAKQESLSKKKKRQEQAAIPNGTSTSQPGTSDIDDLVSKDAASILENW